MSEIILPGWLVASLGCAVLIVAALAMLAFLLVAGVKLIEIIIRKMGIYRAVASYVIAYAQGVRIVGDRMQFRDGKRCVLVNGWPHVRAEDLESKEEP